MGIHPRSTLGLTCEGAVGQPPRAITGREVFGDVATRHHDVQYPKTKSNSLRFQAPIQRLLTRSPHIGRDGEGRASAAPRPTDAGSLQLKRNSVFTSRPDDNIRLLPVTTIVRTGFRRRVPPRPPRAINPTSSDASKYGDADGAVTGVLRNLLCCQLRSARLPFHRQ